MLLPGPPGCSGPGPRIPTPYDDPPIPSAPKTRRTALIVEVEEGRIVGWETPLPGAAVQTVRMNLCQSPAFTGQNVERQLEKILQELGLIEIETRDLLAPWRASLFEAHGLRLLTVMSRADFETASSCACLPYPDELVRVGMIVKEL